MIELSSIIEQKIQYDFGEFFENIFGRQPDITNDNEYYVWLAFRQGYIQRIKDINNQFQTWLEL